MAATGFASLGSVTLPDLLSSSPRNSSLDLESGLDLTRVSDRLLVAGRCWSHQTDRQGHRNNTNQLAEYLNHTFNGRYMIYNFASSDMSFDESLFRYQMQKFTLPRNLTPALKAILHACRSMAAFLSLHSQNVVVVQCRNGIGRSGLVVACFLRYCGLLDSAADAFEYFLHKRFLNTHQLMMEFQVQQNALAAPFHSPTLKRYLRYFNDTCVLGGSVPNPHVLSLRQVIINTIPDFDGNGSCKPGIEVYQNGKMIFTSRPSLTRSSFDMISSNSAQDNTSQSAAVSKATRFFNAFSRRNSSSATSNQLQLDGRDADHFYVDISKEEAIKRAVVCRNGLNADGVPLVLQDDNHIVFCLSSLHIREDIHIRIFHHHRTSNSNYTMFNVVFNTGFIQAGLIRLRLTDLELPLATNPMAATAALSPLVAASGSWSSITTNASTSSLKSSSSSVGSTSSHHESNGSLRNVPSSIDPRFASDFSVDLIIDSTENEPAIVNYQKAFDTTQVRNLLKLSQFHAVKPEPLFIKALEMQGYRQFFARIALQLSDNDIHMAHEFLVHLVHSPIYADLDQDLLSTEQITNSLAIDTPINEDDHDDVDSGSASIIGNESVDSISSTSTSRSIPNSSSSESISQAVDSLHISSDQIQLQDAVMKPNETLESSSFGTCIAKVTTDQLKVPAMQSNHLDLMAQIRSRRKDFEGEIKSLDDNCTVTPKDIALSVPSTKAPIPPPILKTKGGIPPPPPLPPNGKAPPPPPLPSKTSAISCKIPTEVDPNKPKARHRFHWEECSVPNVVGTIWDQSAEFPIDRDRFEELFCINPASFSSQSTNLKDNSLETEDTPRRAQTIVLDLRRVNNVGIALARFYRRMDTPAIISAICTRKPGVLSVDDLLALKTALPTTDEQTLLKEFIKKPEELGAVEKFMLESLSVPLLAWMIDCLLFERQFDTDVDVLCSKLTKMTEAIIMVKDCKALGILLQAVLQLGNLINYEYGKHRSHQRQSQPKAFVLDSLLKLKDVKGADQKITLLVYLISCLESSHPEVLSLPLQLSQCAVVRHWEMDGLLQQAQGIINQHGKLKLKSQEATLDQACALFVEDQRSFLARSSEKLDLLQNLMTNLRCAWKDCREHFGENPSTGGKDDGSNCMCKPEALFAVLDEFCSDMSAITTETVNTRRKSQSADLS